jgi:hypothetical protein
VIFCTAGLEYDRGDCAVLKTPLRLLEDNDMARKPPAPLCTFAITELSDFHIDETDALKPMRLDAVPADRPSNEPTNATNCEPDARGNAATVELDTVGNMYDKTLVRSAERVSMDTTTLDIDATPPAVFKRNAVDAFHSVI